MGDMLTVKQLRQRYGVTAKQIEHALSTRDIEPTQRIGNVRLFDDRAVKRIEATLRETGAMPVPTAVETRGANPSNRDNRVTAGQNA